MTRTTCPRCHTVLPADDIQDGSILCPKCQGLAPSPRALVVEPQRLAANRLVRRLRTLAIGAVVCAFVSVLIVFAWRLWDSDLKLSTAKMKAREIAKACDEYCVDHGKYPDSLESLLIQDSDGKGPYLKSDTLRDPWGHAFQYDASGEHQAAAGVESNMPDIYFVAPDGRTFGNWQIKARP
jgi:general secretion pathway protein G